MSTKYYTKDLYSFKLSMGIFCFRQLRPKIAHYQRAIATL